MGKAEHEKRFKTISEQGKPYVPGRRAVDTVQKTRNTGDKCSRCKRKRVNRIATLNHFRAYIQGMFKSLYGMAVGRYCIPEEIKDPEWRDIGMFMDIAPMVYSR